MFFGFHTAADLEAGRLIHESGVRPESMVETWQELAYQAFLRGELKDGLEQTDQAGPRDKTEASPAVRGARRRQKHLAFDG
jgi:hypothetical protein